MSLQIWNSRNNLQSTTFWKLITKSYTILHATTWTLRGKISGQPSSLTLQRQSTTASQGNWGHLRRLNIPRKWQLCLLALRSLTMPPCCRMISSTEQTHDGTRLQLIKYMVKQDPYSQVTTWLVDQPAWSPKFSVIRSTWVKCTPQLSVTSLGESLYKQGFQKAANELLMTNQAQQ